MSKIELLSPAGDLERLKVTLLYGADAVYIGGQKYSLRANATNFSLDEIKEGCSFAHKLNKKVYLTLNIVFHNEDMDGVGEYIRDVVEAGIDAFIVSDPFIIGFIKKNFPNVEVHLSTQNSTTNYLAVDYFKEEGIDRVVLARELSKNEIKEIIDKTHVDIEVFIHGAMCTCFSGRCALSNYVTNRDANRGGCAQVCRFSFDCPESKKFTMATKDLNMAKYIRDLIEIGVKSLKVEGRMRSLYYLATVIGTYRSIIDSINDNTLTDSKLKLYEDRLSRVANREVSTHYFMKEANFTDQYYTGRQEISNQDYLGLITGYDELNKCLILIERNFFEFGDLVEFFTPDGDVCSYTINEIYDENMNLLDAARHPEQILKLKFDMVLPKYSMIRLIKKHDDNNNLNIAKANFIKREESFGSFATKSSDAIRLYPCEEDIRPSFFHDIDRIIYSFTYARYAGKTQVFSFKNNDHITKRMLHVQFVSKIARTIGRALNLNDDLIEAIALAHDLGHTPIGHQGEYILNDISMRELNSPFAHNIQGVRRCMEVENKGNGLNLSVQVLDGIMCHNGEILSNVYKPMFKDINEFMNEYKSSYKSLYYVNKCSPMTLEGCVVRLSDIISYVGRDIEDAIMLNKIKREDIPSSITDVLGNTNREIINNVIVDIINNSINKPYIKMSDSIYNALLSLKKFNEENIYKKSMSDDERKYFNDGMNKIYYSYLEDVKNNNKDSIIFKLFLNYKIDTPYFENNSPQRMVIDFIAGMTDELFLDEIHKYM